MPGPTKALAREAWTDQSVRIIETTFLGKLYITRYSNTGISLPQASLFLGSKRTAKQVSFLCLNVYPSNRSMHLELLKAP